MDLLAIATCELANVLQRVLPKIERRWWEHLVIPSLNELQRASVELKSEPCLQDLDLSALLAVFVENWSQLSQSARFPRETRNYLMEMKTIRNQICHATSRSMSSERSLRQWHTLKLLLQVLRGSDHVIRLVDAQLLKTVRSYEAELTRTPQNRMAS